MCLASQNGSGSVDVPSEEICWFSTSKKLKYVKELTSFQFQPGQIEKEFLRIKGLARNLKASCGNQTSIKIDELVNVIVLAALPPEFNNVRSLIEKKLESSNASVSLDDIQDRILGEEGINYPQDSYALCSQSRRLLLFDL